MTSTSATTTSTSRRSSVSPAPGERLALFGAEFALTRRGDGDMRPAAHSSGAVLSGLPQPLTSARQVHGAVVHEVVAAAGALRLEADALVTAVRDVPLGAFAADCALIGLVSEEGPVAVVHAGWRGLRAGVIGAAATALGALGARRVHAVISAMIRPECYAFSGDDLDALCAELGEEVRARTAVGGPAFDLHAGVSAALARAGVEVAHDVGQCTACGGDWFSYRARREEGRHALVVWGTGR